MGIHQVLAMTPELQSMMLSGLDTLSMTHRLQQNGVLTLREAGLLKACAGITSHEEVWAATSSLPQHCASVVISLGNLQP